MNSYVINLFRFVLHVQHGALAHTRILAYIKYPGLLSRLYLFLDCLTIQVIATGSFETSVTVRRLPIVNKAEDLNFQQHR